MRRGRRITAAALALCLFLAAAPGAGAYQIHGYSEGLAQAEENGKWGFAGGGGGIVIPLQYDSVVSFSLGMAAVNLDGKLGVIRTDGRYLIRSMTLFCRWALACILSKREKTGAW